MSVIHKIKGAVLLALFLGAASVAHAHCTEFASAEELRKHIDRHITEIELLVKDNSTHSDTLAAKHQELSHHLSRYHSLLQSADMSRFDSEDYSKTVDKSESCASHASPHLFPASFAGSRA